MTLGSKSFLALSMCCLAGLAAAQQPAQPPAQEPLASVATEEGVSLRGAMSVANGRASISNNGEVSAGKSRARLELTRGGTLDVCASTTVHLARDMTPHAAAGSGSAGLMMSLDRGAFETNYQPGAYSDVVLTPDLRLLISGPGEARLKVRVNTQGDTCVDNAGDDAPYVVASSLMDGGTYRVRPGQRVLFVKGSLQEVVDNEKEPCGCPPALPPATLAANGKAPGGPSSTPADTAFPTAVSEGLEAPPKLAGPPIVAAGEAHAQVTATLSSTTPPGPPPPAAPAANAPAPPPPAAQPRAQGHGFFGKLGHFFSRIFGAT